MSARLLSSALLAAATRAPLLILLLASDAQRVGGAPTLPCGPSRGCLPNDEAAGSREYVAAAQAADRTVTPNDDLYEQYQWNLRRIRLPEAWSLTTGSPDVVIAILDTGVSPSHPDLSRKLVPGYDFVEDDPFPEDDHGNGTHVAGIIAAETNNRTGVAGIAWQARIMPVKVLDRSAQGDPERAAEGVLWAVEHGAKIINLGLAGPTRSQALEDAIASAHDRGVLVVAPVASNGTAEVSYPAASPYVLAVAGTDRSDRRLPSSNTGVYVSMAAPGEQIASTFWSSGGVNTYAVAGTTAQAAAHVTGVAGLLLGINPALGPDDLRAILEASADDVGAPGYDPETGFGRVNAARAVTFAAPWSFFPHGAGSYTAPSPGRTVHFPLAMKDANGWNTVITLQNASARAANVSALFVGGTGSSVYRTSIALPPSGSTTLQPARIPGLPAGFVGAALFQADVPIVGVASHDRADADRLTYEGLASGSRWLWLPLLMRGFDGWNSGFAVQNVGSSATTVRAHWYALEGGPPRIERTVRLEPLASAAFYQPADERLPEPWAGSAVLESVDDQPLVAVVNQLHADGSGMSYTGVGRPGTALYAPLLFKNSREWDTGVQIQNTGARPTRVGTTYRRVSGSNEVWLEEVTIESNASMTLYQPANPDLPDAFVGSAVVFSGTSDALASVVNQVGAGAGRAMAYTAPTGGVETVFLPLVYRGFAGWNSGVQVQSTSAALTMINISFFSEDGAVVAAIDDAIDPRGSKSYYLPSVPGIPNGFAGSAIVSCPNGQTIVAIANHTK